MYVVVFRRQNLITAVEGHYPNLDNLFDLESTPVRHLPAAHGICSLTVGEPFAILHDGGQGQAPGSDLNRMAPVGIEIGKKVRIIDGAELRVQVDVEIPLGKSGLDGGRRGLRNRW